MFEAELQSKLKAIFGAQKVSYDSPGDASEQECLFIEVETANVRITDGKQRAKVSGNCVMFGDNNKLPFGYFTKAIAKADASLTKDLFFFDFEENTRRFKGIVQRGFSFVYFFHSQFDPDIGTITNVDITVEES